MCQNVNLRIILVKFLSKGVLQMGFKLNNLFRSTLLLLPAIVIVFVGDLDRLRSDNVK